MQAQPPLPTPIGVGGGNNLGAAPLGCFPMPFFFCPLASDAMVYPMLFPPTGPCFLPPQAIAQLTPYASPPPCFLAAMGAMAAAAAAAATAPGPWVPPPQAPLELRASESSASFSPATTRALQPPGGAAVVKAPRHHHHHMYRRDYNCSRTSLISSSRNRRTCATPLPLPPLAPPPSVMEQPTSAGAGGDAPAAATAASGAEVAGTKAAEKLSAKDALASGSLAVQQGPAAAHMVKGERAVVVLSAGALSLETESDRSAASGAAVAFGADQSRPPALQQQRQQQQQMVMQSVPSPFLPPFLAAPQLQLSCFQVGAAAAAPSQSLTAASPAPRGKHSQPAVDAADVAAASRRSVSGLGAPQAGGAAEGRAALETRAAAGGTLWVDSRRVRAVLRRRQQRGGAAAAAEPLGVAVAAGGLKAHCTRRKACGSPRSHTSSGSSAMDQEQEEISDLEDVHMQPQSYHQLPVATGSRAAAAGLAPHVVPATVAQPYPAGAPDAAAAAAAEAAAEARAALEAELAAVLAEDSEVAGLMKSGFQMDGSSVSSLVTTATAGTADEVLTELVC